jgi:hypothetical protein
MRPLQRQEQERASAAPDHQTRRYKFEGLKSLPFLYERDRNPIKMSDPMTITMCKDLLRWVYTLQGTAFIESELAHYKAFEARRFGAPAVPAPVPAPAPVAVAPPAPPALVLHLKEPAPVPLARPSPAPLCTVKKEGLADTEANTEAPIADLPAAAGAGAIPPVENKVIEMPVASTAVEKTRYKRAELSDEERCIEPTARGSRCTLGREAGSTYCSRHGKKHSS